MLWHLSDGDISRRAGRSGGVWTIFIILGRTVFRGGHPSLLGMERPLGMALHSTLRQGEPLLHISQHRSLLDAWLGRLGVQPTGPMAQLLLLQPMPTPQGALPSCSGPLCQGLPFASSLSP